MEAKHKRKRRKEARAVGKERAELEDRQPDMARQPMAFSTNKYWEEEIKAGPGPPKGWKRDSMDGGLAKETTKSSGQQRQNDKVKNRSVFSNNPPGKTAFSEPMHCISSSPSSAEPIRPPPRIHGHSLDHRQSTLDSLKDTFRSSMSPETWNFKRYEREDEPLWGLNDAMSRMWDRARPSHIRRGSAVGPGEHRRSISLGRQRAGTADSDRYDYYRARNPEVNELHPPVVSQLPATRAEVAWMLQPPPSRAVMEGKVRPGAEDMSSRKPLAVIGSTREDQSRRRALSGDRRGITERTRTGSDKEESRPQPASGDDLVAEKDRDGDADEEQETEEESQTDSKPLRSASLPHIDFAKPRNKVAAMPKEASTSRLQRPPLAVVASARRTSSSRTLTSPVLYSGSKSRNASPAATFVTRTNGKGELEGYGMGSPPEWDYLLQLCLPQMPPRTRSSLPSGVWV